MAGLRQQHKATGVCIQSVHRMRFAGMVDLREPVLKRVAVESPAGMHGQRGGFIEDDQGIVFVREPKDEPYGTVAVFEDLYGNLWDLLEPRERGRTPP